jgi:DNA-binding transcriptional LysR family regulator
MNWDDYRLFMACVEAGSLRKAGERLRIDAATVARRIERLEGVLGERLFVRLVEGLRLTTFGRSILDDVNQMGRAVQNLTRRTQAGDLHGIVRLAVTEGIVTYWILPKLIEWQQANRNLTIDLRASMQEADVAKLDADIAIQFHRPKNPDMIIAKLGRLHTYPFVSIGYDSRFGTPRTLEEALQHRFVQQSSPLLDDAAMARALGVEDVSGIVGIRTNASSAILYAVERGAGIGVLPTYSLALGAPLVPVDMNVEHNMEIYAVYHPDMRHSKLHMQVIEWLRRIFDSVRYPCFRDEFIHPSKLVELMRETSSGLSVRGYAAANLGSSVLGPTRLNKVFEE